MSQSLSVPQLGVSLVSCIAVLASGRRRVIGADNTSTYDHYISSTDDIAWTVIVLTEAVTKLG